jgi:hypothetical protein
MNGISNLLIWQYGLPLLAALLVIYLVERRNKVWPSRDQEELLARVTTTFFGLLFFSIIQAIVRTV